MPNPAPGGPTDRSHLPPRPTLLSTGCVVLVRIQGAVNLGLIARLASNLGVTDVRLVDPRCRVEDPLAQQFATSWGAMVLAGMHTYATLEEAAADCALIVATSGEFHAHEMGPPLPIASLPAVVDAHAGARWALVFGGESDGLSAGELASCQHYLHLDTFGENRSYNLTHAVAICGYLLSGLSLPPASPWRAPSAHDRLLRLVESRLVQLLSRSGHPPLADPRFRRRLRRLIGNLPVSDAQAHALLGMIGSIDRSLGPASSS